MIYNPFCPVSVASGTVFRGALVAMVTIVLVLLLVLSMVKGSHVARRTPTNETRRFVAPPLASPPRIVLSHQPHAQTCSPISSTRYSVMVSARHDLNFDRPAHSSALHRFLRSSRGALASLKSRRGTALYQRGAARWQDAYTAQQHDVFY